MNCPFNEHCMQITIKVCNLLKRIQIQVIIEPNGEFCWQILDKLYTDAATYIWNGNVCSGQEAIMKFIGTLPISEHVLETVDSQPLASKICR